MSMVLLLHSDTPGGQDIDILLRKALQMPPKRGKNGLFWLYMPKNHLFTPFWRHFDALSAKYVDFLTPWGVRMQFKYHEHLR